MAFEGKTAGPPDWCCVDCLSWLANGELPDATTAEDRATWREGFEQHTDGAEVTLGMLAEYHDCTDGDGNIADDCECEQQSFSWSPCATCGTPLGGERAAVTFWT